MADTTPSEAALRLQTRLEELGWKPARLAEAIDVSPGVVSRWLAGKRVPSLEMAFKIQNSEVALPAEIWLPVVPVEESTRDLSAEESGGHAKQSANDALAADKPTGTA